MINTTQGGELKTSTDTLTRFVTGGDQQDIFDLLALKVHISFKGEKYIHYTFILFFFFFAMQYSLCTYIL